MSLATLSVTVYTPMPPPFPLSRPLSARVFMCRSPLVLSSSQRDSATGCQPRHVYLEPMGPLMWQQYRESNADGLTWRLYRGYTRRRRGLLSSSLTGDRLKTIYLPREKHPVQKKPPHNDAFPAVGKQQRAEDNSYERCG